jgi:hypothetical protein
MEGEDPGFDDDFPTDEPGEYKDSDTKNILVGPPYEQRKYMVYFEHQIGHSIPPFYICGLISSDQISIAVWDKYMNLCRFDCKLLEKSPDGKKHKYEVPHEFQRDFMTSGGMPIYTIIKPKLKDEIWKFWSNGVCEKSDNSQFISLCPIIHFISVFQTFIYKSPICDKKYLITPEQIHNMKVLTLFSLENDMLSDNTIYRKTTALSIIHKTFETEFNDYRKRFDESDCDTYWNYIWQLAQKGIHLINIRKKSGKHYLWMIKSKFRESQLLELAEKKAPRQIYLKKRHDKSPTYSRSPRRRSRSRSPRRRSRSRSPRRRSRSRSPRRRSRSRSPRRRSSSRSPRRRRSRSYTRESHHSRRRRSRSHTKESSRSRSPKTNNYSEQEGVVSHQQEESQDTHDQESPLKPPTMTDEGEESLSDAQRKKIRILHLEAAIETAERHLQDLKSRLEELRWSCK